MVCAGLQLIGFILGVISWIGMIATCASPEWRRNSRGNTIIDMSVRYEGLWSKCSLLVTGQTRCTPYDSFFVGVPSVLQVCRALMIASLVLGLLAILITIFGIRCTSIGNNNPQAKARAAIVGGALFIVAGLHVGMAVSIYAWCTSSQCFDHLQVTGFRTDYEMGPAVIGGWIVMTSAFWSAFLTIVNYNSTSSPAKTMDLSQIRADSLTGQFSDMVSEGATGVYKPKSPVDSGYISTGVDSNWGLYSTVSYPSSTISSSYRPTSKTKLIKSDCKPHQNNTQMSYNATVDFPTSGHHLPQFGSFRASFANSKSCCDGTVRRPISRVATTRERECHSPISLTSVASSSREMPLRRPKPKFYSCRSQPQPTLHFVNAQPNRSKRIPMTRNYKSHGRRQRSAFNNYPQFGTLRRNAINSRTMPRATMAHPTASHVRPKSPFYPAPQFSSLRHSLNDNVPQCYQRESRHRRQFFTNFSPEMYHSDYGEPNHGPLIATSAL